MGVDGRSPKVLAEGLADGPDLLRWRADGEGLFFTMDARGEHHIHYVGLDGQVRAKTEGAMLLTLSSISDQGRGVGVKTSPHSPPDIVRIERLNGRGNASITQLTQVNEDIFHGLELGEVEEVNYASADGTEIQGWIVKPPGFDANKNYPLVLQIHGGPHGMYNVGFNFSFQWYAAQGYVVLYTNPRGSTGYGSDFANAIRHQYPGPVDYSDLMAGVDATLDKGWVDQKRLHVTGCSGGGILTTWVIGQTDRFASAVARCPVVNWLSMLGTTDVSAWTFKFFPEPFWEDPTVWLQNSPVMHVGKVTTPTLLMTGERDLRTPIAEAEQYFAALTLRGVPSKLIPMRGEFHGTGSIPSNFMRTLLMSKKWFEEYPSR